MLILAGHAFGAGAYQRTDDRKKTVVWNNDPKPGDAAEWTGQRDSEGYAEGPGTLTWLQPQKQFATGSNIAGTKKVPISRYTGTMVHGKFEGAVVTVDRGKTYHANFVDGQRKGNWAFGPVIAKATSAEPAAAPDEPKKSSAVPAKLAAAEQAEPSVDSKISEEAEPEPPTEGPDEEKPAVTSQKPAVSKTTGQKSADVSTVNSQPSTGLIARASEESGEPATPRQQPVTKKAALAPGAVRAIEKPGQTVAKKSEKPKQAAETIRKATRVERPKPEIAEVQPQSPAEGPLEKANVQRPTPNAQRSTAEPPHPSPFIPQPSSKETPVDDSIRTLTGPPASLRIKSTPAPAATVAATVAATISATSMAPASPPSNTPKLNAVQAMDIADIEARTRGYDLGDYQLPKAEYNATDDTWSVSYVGRDDKNAKRLSITVQDKSGKGEVKK